MQTPFVVKPGKRKLHTTKNWKGGQRQSQVGICVQGYTKDHENKKVKEEEQVTISIFTSWKQERIWGQ